MTRDEMVCDRCGRRHDVVWFAPSDYWNAVMREGDRGKPDEFGFCCPTCFMQLAGERGIGNGMWMVAPDPVHGMETRVVSPEVVQMTRLPEVTYSCGCKRSQVGAIRLNGTSACPVHKVNAEKTS